MASVSDKLSKTRQSASSADNPVDLGKTELKRVFYSLTDQQTDFFTTYFLGSLFSNSSQTPVWMQNTPQKEQQIMQMLSNASKMLKS